MFNAFTILHDFEYTSISTWGDAFIKHAKYRNGPLFFFFVKEYSLNSLAFLNFKILSTINLRKLE